MFSVSLICTPLFHTVLHTILHVTEHGFSGFATSRCGACLNVCPVYRHIGGHSYGSVYPGPIGAVLTPLLNDDPEFADLPFASSLCGACYEACPVKIPLHDMLVALRRRQMERGRGKSSERLAYRGYQLAFSSARRYRGTFRLARMAQSVLGVKNGQLDAQLGPLRGWTATRTAPALAEKSFRNRFASLKQDVATADSVGQATQEPGDGTQPTNAPAAVMRDE